jgi:hypothetical protein
MIRGCLCLCEAWGHRGVCTGWAETTVEVRSLGLGTIAVPMCHACAEAVRRDQGDPPQP